MKNIVLHGLTIEEDSKKYISQIIDRLSNEGSNISITQKFFERNRDLLGDQHSIVEDINSDFDSVFSLGGDGTFLEAARNITTQKILQDQ